VCTTGLIDIKDIMCTGLLLLSITSGLSMRRIGRTRNTSKFLILLLTLVGLIYTHDPSSSGYGNRRLSITLHARSRVNIRYTAGLSLSLSFLFIFFKKKYYMLRFSSNNLSTIVDK
jgi:hypothetical protein